MKKVKLAYILHDIQVGGVEVALISAIPTLYRDYDLEVIVLGRINHQLLAHLPEEQRACFKAFNVPLLTYPVAIFWIASRVLNFAPDVVVSSLWRASMLGVLIKKLKPDVTFISFVHSTTFFHKLDALFTKAAIRSADHLFADSVATREFVQSCARPASDISIISFFLRPSSARKTNPPLTGPIRLMFLGRLSKVKNLIITIDAVHFLRAKGLNITLDIYGPDDGMEQTVRRHIQKLNAGSIIKVKGVINAEQKAIAFAEHHILFQLSSNEGMAMSVAEAMQHGLVCFTTPVGEIKNYAQDMQTAVFADVLDEHEWRRSLSKIERVLRDPTLYNQISDNSFHHFQTVETYSNSLTKAISAHTNVHENITRSYAG